MWDVLTTNYTKSWNQLEVAISESCRKFSNYSLTIFYLSFSTYFSDAARSQANRVREDRDPGAEHPVI